MHYLPDAGGIRRLLFPEVYFVSGAESKDKKTVLKDHVNSFINKGEWTCFWSKSCQQSNGVTYITRAANLGFGDILILKRPGGTPNGRAVMTGFAVGVVLSGGETNEDGSFTVPVAWVLPKLEVEIPGEGREWFGTCSRPYNYNELTSQERDLVNKTRVRFLQKHLGSIPLSRYS